MDGLRYNTVLFVISHLDFPTAESFPDGPFHGRRYAVCIENNTTLCIPGGTACRLHQTGFRTQEAFLVRVQNGHKGNLRNIQALPEQVDADQDIKYAHAKVTDNLHSFNGIYVMVHITHLYTLFFKESGQVLCHLLG